MCGHQEETKPMNKLNRRLLALNLKRIGNIFDTKIIDGARKAAV
jgi:hypothetical protein